MHRMIVVLVLLLTTSGLTAAQAGDLLTSLAARSNLRAGPGVEWSIVGTYDAGTPVRLDGQAFSGSWVRGIVPDGNVGWFISTAVNISADQAAGLPAKQVEAPFTLSAPAGGARAADTAPAAAEESAPAESAPAAARPAASGGGVNTTTADRVNMRVNPNERVIRTLGFQEAVTVDGRSADNNWVRVRTNDGARGWVAVNFVVISASDFAGLPVVEGGAILPGEASSDPAQAAAPDPAISPVVGTAPVGGFNVGGHVNSFSATTVEAMRSARMTWVKKQWRYQPGQSPNVVNGLISAAHGNGFRILLGIVGPSSGVTDPGFIDGYAAFVAGVAANGADAIEIWNEPNIDREWAAGSISPANYTNLLRAAYNAIKAANPNTMVVSGAPAPTGFFGGCGGNGCDDNLFVQGMAAAGAANYMDCIGVHYNEGIIPPSQTSGDPRGNSGHYSRYFWGMVNTYYDAFGGARPLCFTELGYLSPEGFPPLPGGFAWAQNVSVAQQAAWLDEAVALSANSGRVRLVIIWNVDFTNYGSDPMAGYAMIRPNGSCPACVALGN